MLAIEFPTQAIADFCQRHHIRRLSVFGSVLRDDFSPDSDIDILVEFEQKAEVDLFEFSGMRLELMELLGRQVDLVTPAALKSLIKDVIQESRMVVYEV
jgi:predicted nucleotidyltransferase